MRSAWCILEGYSIDLHFPTKDFLTQTLERAVWKGTSYTKASADQRVYNYLFQLSIKGGAFYSSKAEIWQLPSCEILLTKVLSQGQGNVVCWAPVPSSL